MQCGNKYGLQLIEWFGNYKFLAIKYHNDIIHCNSSLLTVDYLFDRKTTVDIMSKFLVWCRIMKKKEKKNYNENILKGPSPFKMYKK